MTRYRRSHLYIAEQFTGKPLTEIPPADFLVYSDDPLRLTIEDWYDYSQSHPDEDDGEPYTETMVANVGDWVTYSDIHPEGDFDNYCVYRDNVFRETFVPAKDEKP